MLKRVFKVNNHTKEKGWIAFIREIKICHTPVLLGLKQAGNELPPQKDQTVFEYDAHQHALDSTHSFPS